MTCRYFIGGKTVNRDRIEGNWTQLRGSIRQGWATLTRDSPGIVAGKRDINAGAIQNSYGVACDEVKKQLSAWKKSQSNTAAPGPQSNHRPQP